MPASRQRSRSPCMALAVMAMMGTCPPCACSRWRMRRVALRPSRPGICTSISTRSTWPARSTASSPLSTSVIRCPIFSSRRRARRWFTGLSSATRMRRPRPSSLGTGGNMGGSKGGASGIDARAASNGDKGRSGPACSCTAASRSGTLKRKVLPSPGALSTAISPCIKMASRRQIVKPRPVPPNWRVVEPSTWAKASKIIACLSAGMPMPVSATASTTRHVSPCSSSMATVTVTPPSRVNLTALPSRLSSTWRSRPGSPLRVRGMPGGTMALSASPFCWALRAIERTLACTSSRRSNGTSSRSSLPASILEKSRMSLTMVSSASAEAFTKAMSSRCWASSVDSSTSSVMPRMPFMGVRISWLMLARNSLLARLAAWADSTARCMASRAARCSLMSMEKPSR